MKDDTATHPFDDVNFAAPPAWLRRTIIAFVAPSTRPNRATAVFVREPLADGETVHSLSEKHLLDVRTLAEFRMLQHRVREEDGVVKVEMAYEWSTDDGPVEQTSTFMVSSDERGAMVTNAITTCSKEEAGSMLPVFSALVGRLRAARPRAFSGIERTRGTETEPCVPGFPMPGCRRPSRPTIGASETPSTIPAPSTPPPVRMPNIPMPGARGRP